MKIPPGSTTKIAFTVTRSTPGTYQVLLEGQQGQFTVAASPAPGRLGTGTIIAIIAAIVVLVAAIVFVFIRARKRRAL
ncbi:MAG: hypothetical protein U9R04_04695 [Chloroflexota bacterium]|nr:hypothetical protein [Chloroflexota bacterium]